jgi:23S rRNA pseudouridine1911/1915/1917 synthase
MADAPPEPGPIHITASREQVGQRIDRLLADAIGTISRSRVKALIEEGALSRTDAAGDEAHRCHGEGAPSPADETRPPTPYRPRSQAGDSGRVGDKAVFRRAIPVTEPSEPARAGSVYTLMLPPPAAATPLPQAIPFPILYEDRDLIVLDKPAGLVVHPAPGNRDGTLVNALLAHCGPWFTGIGAEKRPGIVHRLDKDTSGVMVVAKTQLANDVLSAAFAARDLERTYLALCWGLPNPLRGEIEGPIGRDKRDRKRMAMVSHGGKAALTRYHVIRAYATSVALLECRLASGRTHQIRVHLSARGHSIVGDPLYLRRIPAVSKDLPEPLRHSLLDFPRQALHAASLGFSHPRTGEAMRFETPPPDDMRALTELLDAHLSGH